MTIVMARYEQQQNRLYRICGSVEVLQRLVKATAASLNVTYVNYLYCVFLKSNSP